MMKQKRLLSAVLCIALAAGLLAGCGNKSADESTTAAVQATATPVAMTDGQAMAAYQSIIDRYQGFADGMEATTTYCGPDQVFTSTDANAIGDLAQSERTNLGYCLKDLDGNGIPELLISSTNPDAGNVIIEMYTLQNSVPVRVLASSERSRFSLRADNSLCYTGSSSAFESTCAVLSYSGTALTVTDCLTVRPLNDNTEDLHYYHTSALVTSDAQMPDGSEITGDEFNNLATQMQASMAALTLTAIIPTTYTESEALTVYQSVLDRYEDFVNGGTYGTTSCGADQTFTNPDANAVADIAQEEKNSLGYRLDDLDGNNVPELIFGCTGNTSDDDFYRPIVVEIYTIQGGQPVRVLASANRSRFSLKADGTIYYYGSNGDSGACNAILQLNGATLTVTDYLESRIPDGDKANTKYYHTSYYVGADEQFPDGSEVSKDDYASLKNSMKENLSTPALIYIQSASSSGSSAGTAISYTVMTDETALSIYQPVLDRYKDFQNGGTYDSDYSSTGNLFGTYKTDISTIGVLANYEKDNLGYCMKDVDSNGTPELIIGSTNADAGNVIVDMYTIVNGKPARVVASSDRSSFYLDGNSQIIWSGSSGASNSCVMVLQYDSTGLTVSEQVESRPDDSGNTHFYHTHAYVSGDNTFPSGAEISEDEFSSLCDQLCSNIPALSLTPLQ